MDDLGKRIIRDQARIAELIDRAECAERLAQGWRNEAAEVARLLELARQSA